MERDLSVSSRGVVLPASLEAEIRERAAKLERLYPRLIGCTVMVEGPGRKHENGGPYRVRLDLRAPGAEPVIVDRQPQAKLELAINEAFDAASRRLEDLLGLQREEVKIHDGQPRGRVVRLFPEPGYGFLETLDGREVYFNRNAVLGEFERLRVGDTVRFHEARGDEGPQASTVVPEA